MAPGDSDAGDGEQQTVDPRDVIDREDCSRCGGSGETTKMVAGRSGAVPCDECDNPPASALPDEVPVDPEAAVEDIEARLQALDDREAAIERVQDKQATVTQLLKEIADDDILDDDGEAVINHLKSEIGRVIRPYTDRNAIHADRQYLKQRKRRLSHFIDVFGRDNLPLEVDE